MYLVRSVMLVSFTSLASRAAPADAPGRPRRAARRRAAASANGTRWLTSGTVSMSAERAPGRVEPPRPIPARRQRGADVADLAAHEPQAPAVEAPAEIDAGALVPVPGADDHARLVPGGGDRRRPARPGFPRARRSGRRRAARARAGSRPAPSRTARAPRARAPPARACGSGSAAASTASGKRASSAVASRPTVPSPITSTFSPVERRAVEDQVDRRLHVGEQRGPLRRPDPRARAGDPRPAPRTSSRAAGSAKTRRPIQAGSTPSPTATTSPTEA